MKNEVFLIYQIMAGACFNERFQRGWCATSERGLITQHECMPAEGMQTSSYPLTHTSIALYWQKLWNASKDVK